MTELWLLANGVGVAALLGFLKWSFPRVRAAAPNFLWPLMTLVLAWIGTSVCQGLGAACSGSPYGWNEPEAQAFISSVIAQITRETVKAAQERGLLPPRALPPAPPIG